MSNLYLIGNADMRKNPFTARGRNEITLDLRVGSRDDSRRIAEISLYYDEQGKKFVLWVNERIYKVMNAWDGV